MQAHIKIPIPTQRRVLKDGTGMLCWTQNTGRLVEADKDQKYLNHQVKICTGEPIASGYQGYPEKP